MRKGVEAEMKVRRRRGGREEKRRGTGDEEGMRREEEGEEELKRLVEELRNEGYSMKSLNR